MSASVLDIVINQMGLSVIEIDQVVTVKRFKLQNTAAPNQSVNTVAPIPGNFFVKETDYSAFRATLK